MNSIFRGRLIWGFGAGVVLHLVLVAAAGIAFGSSAKLVGAGLIALAALVAVLLYRIVARHIDREITARQQAELELNRANRALRATSACNEALVQTQSEDQLLAEICRVIVDDAGYRMAWIGIAENDQRKTVRPVAVAGRDDGYVANVDVTWSDGERGRGPTGRAIRTGRVTICRDMLSDPAFAPWRDAARARGFASSIVLPLVHEGRVFGALSIYATEPDAFDEAEAKRLLGLGEDIAFGVAAFRNRAEREKAVQELARLQQLLNQTQAIAQVGGWEYDVVSRRSTWTCELYRIHGVSAGTHDINDVEAAIRFYAPEQRECIANAFQRAIDAGVAYDLELQMTRADGRRIWTRTIGEPVRDASGRVVIVRGTVQDITERKQTEEQVRQLNAELEQRVAERTRELNQRMAELQTMAADLQSANRELESFAYSVSHDLRTPLRSIDGFGRILLRDETALSARGRENLERMRAATQRMGRLIDDLLQLSRTARAELHRGPVDLSGIATAIVEELKTSDPARAVEWAIAPALTATGDPVLLRAVLENLLGNAWKFTSRVTGARIEFGASRRNGEAVFHVRDNGAGFDMQYAEKLFGAFQRLHAHEDFPGSGVGLATAQRIIHRHGGKIWAESQVDAGSTFYFTLPGGREIT